MKHMVVIIVALVMALTIPVHLAHAYGGGSGGGTSKPEASSSVNLSFTGEHNSASTGVQATPSNITVAPHEHSKTANSQIKSAPLTFFEWVETIGDVSTGGAQAGVYGYAVYCWYVGKAVVLVPVAICWHVPKHTTRTIYGLATGNLDTVHKVNSKTWHGQLANGLVIEGLINVQHGRQGKPAPYPGASRTHAPVKDIIHFRGVK